MLRNQQNSRKLFILRDRTPQPHRKTQKIKSLNSAILNPSPETIMRVSNKLLSLNIIKSSFLKSPNASPLVPAHNRYRLGTPNRNCNITKLDMKDYGLDDSQAEIYSTAFRSLNKLESLNLRGNRLQDSGTSSILDAINKDNIRVLDISNNKIGMNGIKSLITILENEDSVLQDLSLENVKLRADALEILCTGLERNLVLKSLNLSNNKLGSGAGKHIAEMLDTNNCLESLDLHWNQIKGVEAIYMFNALKNNTSLKTLDLSWNPLGQDKVSNSIPVISLSLAENERLLHLDLSNNNFSFNDCEVLGKGLKRNHTIKGLHFLGNYGKVNALGFIEPLQYLPQTRSNKHSCRLISKNVAENTTEYCWICRNWMDCVIEWDPARMIWNRRLKHFALDKLSTQEEPVYVHLEIDDYSPFLLKKNHQNIYTCTRSLPPGKNRFFFTYRGVAQISNQYQIEGCSATIEKFVYFYKGFSKKIMAVIVNYLENTNTEQSCIPRPEILEYLPPPGDIPEPQFPPWSIENSIFAGYTPDTPEQLSKCFEVDWANTKISKFLKSDTTRFAVKEILRSEYSKM